jgi:hypothetical protein
MDAAEVVNKAAADLAPMAIKDYLDDIGEFLDDANNFELADGSTVDIAPALNGLRAVEAKIESDAKVIAALRGALVEIRHLAGRDGPSKVIVALNRIEERARIALQIPTDEQTAGKNDG